MTKNVRAAKTVRRAAAEAAAPPRRRLSDRAASSAPAVGIHVARLVGMGAEGVAMVAFETSTGLERVVAAKLVGALDGGALGGAVAVMFEGGRPDRPVVLGPIAARTGGGAPAALSPARELSIEIGARRLVLAADEEVVLRCGPATITLTKDGRVAIRGVKILSRASGANKIRGGSVQIN